MIVGLTGGMGCGITTAAGFFAELGAVVISADKIARELTEPHTVGWQKIKGAFGDEYFSPDREELDRKKLGKLIFDQEEAREKLNALLHPLIIEEIEKRIGLWRDSGKIVIVEAPLLIEAGLLRLVDRLVVLSVPADVRIARLIKRDQFRKAELVKRMAAQMPLNEKVKMADLVIDNSKSTKKLKEEVARKWQEWQETTS